MAATPWVKIGPFGAREGTPVNINSDAPIKLNKLEALTTVDTTDPKREKISGIRFNYTDRNLQDQQSVTFGAGTGTHVLFDATQDPEDYVLNLYGYADTDADTNVVHKLGIRSRGGGHRAHGEDKGKYFEIPVASGSIVAFFGLSDGDALNAVGAYVVPRVGP